MTSVHFAADLSGPTALIRTYSIPSGRAALLFGLLAGVGASLLAKDRWPARRRTVRARLLFRAALLLPAGLALQMLDHGALVILQYYAILFLVAAAALPLSDRALLVWSVGLTVLAPVVYLGVWHWQPHLFAQFPAVITDPPSFIAGDLLLSGSYPVLTWSAPLLFGMWLGRRDLRGGVGRWRTVLAAAAVALSAWGLSQVLVATLGVPADEPSWLQLAMDEPHNQMPLWLIDGSAAAVAVLGLALMAVARWPRLTWPLVALGQLALTVYVTHLLLLSAWPGLLRHDEILPALLSVILFSAVAALTAVLWRRYFSTGPLEVVLRLPWMTFRRSRWGVQDSNLRHMG